MSSLTARDSRRRRSHELRWRPSGRDEMAPSTSRAFALALAHTARRALLKARQRPGASGDPLAVDREHEHAGEQHRQLGALCAMRGRREEEPVGAWAQL